MNLGGEPQFGRRTKFFEVVEAVESATPILVDIPIGLPDANSGSRLCDAEARAALGEHHVCVFSIPSRDAVYARDIERARALNVQALGKGINARSWGLVPKIREVDTLLQKRPDLRGRVREVHREVCFWGLAGKPIAHRKSTERGYGARLDVLLGVAPQLEEVVADAVRQHCGFGVERDDILDAMAAAICAGNIDQCRNLPAEAQKDSTGLPMEMVYWPAGALD